MKEYSYAIFKKCGNFALYHSKSIMEGIFNRLELLLGSEALDLISSKKVLVVGVGGVGSWCAESLIRTGIRHLTIVDADNVSVTNINRQLMATTKTVGRAKVEVLRERLLEINPDAEVIAIQDVFNKENSESFNLGQYDYIIDCIDSLKDKIELLLQASATKASVFSSMGAALKMDPTRIHTAEFWQVKGCPLGAAMRRRMKHMKRFPSKKIQCVFSDELLENKGAATPELTEQEGSFTKAQTNGSLAHITAIYGFTLAGLVIKHITK